MQKGRQLWQQQQHITSKQSHSTNVPVIRFLTLDKRSSVSLSYKFKKHIARTQFTKKLSLYTTKVAVWHSRSALVFTNSSMLV